MSSDVSEPCVIVGAGRVGKSLARLLEHQHVPSVLIDLDPCKPGTIVGDATRPTKELAECISGASTLVLALPYVVAARATDVIAPLMRSGALFVDTMSIKTGPMGWVGSLKCDVGALGINPLFSPSEDWSGRTVASVIYRWTPALDLFLVRLRRAGAKVAPMTTSEHDKTMAERQLATHALLLTYASFLAQRGFDHIAADIGPFPYKMLIALIGRVLQSEAQLYAEIQSYNPFGGSVRSELADHLLRFTLLSENAGLEGTLANLNGLFGGRLDQASKVCSEIFASKLLDWNSPSSERGY
jgi:prephenate dehydrogenase